MVAQGFTVDLNKPLVFQVGHLGDDYEEWVHQPIVSKEGPRFFKSDFWEFLTLTRWWVVPVIWLPVSLWCISMSVSRGLSLPEIVPLIALGIFIWTFIEYTLHRFLFHIKTKSYWGNTAHYLLHGCHHKHPMDHLRLVFPPTATAILCFPFWNLVKLFTTPSVTPALFGGGMLGYVMYDVTHYYLHHAQPTKAVTKNLKDPRQGIWYNIVTMGHSVWDTSHHKSPQRKAIVRKHSRTPTNVHKTNTRSPTRVKIQSLALSLIAPPGDEFPESEESPAMAVNDPPHELASGSPCCLAWQRKYLGMKNRRDACKASIEILQKAMGIVNDEKTNLRKKLGEMVDNTNTNQNVSVVNVSLEKEIFDLKSEILSLQQKLERNHQEKNEGIKILQDQKSGGEKEISELKNLLKIETLRADNSEEEKEQICKELNKTKALLVKYKDMKPHDSKVEKEISLVKNLLASQRQETESERKKAESEKKKADQYLSSLEVLRTTAHKTSSDLLTLTSNLEAVKKQLESEKQKTLKERKRADMESAKAKEQMKLAEGLSKKFEIIRTRNEELKKEAELQSASSKVKFAENSAKLEEQIRLLEMNQKSAMDWKSRVDDLSQQLQESHLVTEGLKKQVHELSLSQKKSAETHSVSPHNARDLDKAKLRLLKKELKFERKCAKHSERVAEYERILREFQAEEIGELKLKFGSLTNRMSLLGEYFSGDVEGTAGFAKAEGRMRMQMLESNKNRNGKNHPGAKCRLVASSGSQEEARKLSTQLVAKSKQGLSGPVSGNRTLHYYYYSGNSRRSTGYPTNKIKYVPENRYQEKRKSLSGG
ncbi:unnamed protein product [Eruca vesicaria subsp. sativa]|uniref:Fatty acid hydroxylase domain-containing protein n=1 Tax=Eruca vesicaria subsp. sativa TaxID=29727 RepID=A0ABC8JWA1_ERUVS|nr:unnamed protein product [Eruca vesicaria subsp. sativa]